LANQVLTFNPMPQDVWQISRAGVLPSVVNNLGFRDRMTTRRALLNPALDSLQTKNSVSPRNEIQRGTKDARGAYVSLRTVSRPLEHAHLLEPEVFAPPRGASSSTLFAVLRKKVPVPRATNVQRTRQKAVVLLAGARSLLVSRPGLFESKYESVRAGSLGETNRRLGQMSTTWLKSGTRKLETKCETGDSSDIRKALNRRLHQMGQFSLPWKPRLSSIW